MDDRVPPREPLVYDRADMSELVAVTPTVPADRSPVLVALDAEAPRLEDLFTFMVDAELRVQRLRMRMEDASGPPAAKELSTIELILAHPGRARITTRRSTDPLSRDYRVWASDGSIVTTYDALDERASVRPLRPMPVGAADPSKRRYAQVWTPRTQLPVSSVVDTMIDPHGLILERAADRIGLGAVGTTFVAGGRETLAPRADHPRSAHVLTDRPDRWMVGVDRMTGFITPLAEHVGTA